MSAAECLGKTYVKLRYIPPSRPARPMDCKQVRITKDPEIRIFSGQISRLEGRPEDELIGIDLHCVVPSTAGAGGIIFLLQVSSYIEWEVEFYTTSGSVRQQLPHSPAPWARGNLLDDLFNGQSLPGQLPHSPAPPPQLVRETHRVYVSLPMMFKLEGPRIALMAISPWKLKLPVYAARIWNAFRKLNELEKPLAMVMGLKKGLCPDDITALEAGLARTETELNSLLQRAAANSSEGEIAWRMRNGIEGAGRFAGTRVA